MRNSTFALSDRENLVSITKVVLGALALFASAQISIEIKPVAVTLGTLMVLIIGLTYSRKESIATVISYISAGAMGLPVFTNMQGGFAKLTGPSGGYLFGFMLAAYAMSYMKEKFNFPNIYNCILGQILMYAPGILWLSTFIGMEAAIYKGFFVYIPSGIVKTILLVSALRIIKGYKS